ncbi:centrosomal protein of 72 kDa [Suncus etruscus]|uniref:centrosomal protein of 72 kDa n=1 Tax=Suncus etruscus TaxID=109475 RepID=UPI00211045BC|nr:centrosomal protein of 72 kDa [Suncus etruscus]
MAPAVPRLVLLEEKVRDKSGLAPHSDLAELQSLSIPGTYQEKITHLGSSLMNLTGLRSLDLSRNSLVSLEGIQYLVALESLNLYYNCISSLTEVFRLHPLTKLAEVDFRLNPVVKNESDYRLFMVHMLPKLRQLDDRLVRESERKSSQLHFTAEEPLDSEHSVSTVFQASRPPTLRAKNSDLSAKKSLVMDADDEAVLTLIAECEWDLSNPPCSSSSSQQEHEANCHASHESRHLLSPRSLQLECGDAGRKSQERRKSSSQGCYIEKRSQLCGELPMQPGAEPEAFELGQFPPDTDSVDTEDTSTSSLKSRSSLSSQKLLNPGPAADKYRKCRMPGGRFQAPLDQECLNCLARTDGVLSPEQSRQSNLEGRSEKERSEASEPADPRPPSRSGAKEGVLLEALLDLVDTHWTGCHSLHSDKAFLAQAQRVLASVSELAASTDLSPTDQEQDGLFLVEQQPHSLKLAALVAELSSTRKERDDLRQHLDRSLEENSSLKSLLLSMKKEVKNADTSATLNLQISGLQTSVQRLSEELIELKQHLEHYDKIQELIHMLQESHSSLVSTNEHLLQELAQARAQHQAEVEQLHWSYKELKKTLALFPATGASLNSCRS